MVEHGVDHSTLWPLSRDQLEQRFGVPVSRPGDLPVVVNTEATYHMPGDLQQGLLKKMLICPVCAKAGTPHEKKPVLQISWNIDWHKNPHNSKNTGHNARSVASLVTLGEAYTNGYLANTTSFVLKFSSRPTRAQVSVSRPQPAFSAAPSQTGITCVLEGLFGEEVTSAPTKIKSSKQYADLMREVAAKRAHKELEEPEPVTDAPDAESGDEEGSRGSVDEQVEGASAQLAPPTYGREALATEPTAEVRVNNSS